MVGFLLVYWQISKIYHSSETHIRYDSFFNVMDSLYLLLKIHCPPFFTFPCALGGDRRDFMSCINWSPLLSNFLMGLTNSMSAKDLGHHEVIFPFAPCGIADSIIFLVPIIDSNVVQSHWQNSVREIQYTSSVHWSKVVPSSSNNDFLFTEQLSAC